MTTLVQPRFAVAIATLRSIQWPIVRLGPYSCILGFLLIGAASLGLSRAVLIAWQWQRVDVTDSLWLMLLQGLRSDLMTLGYFAAPAVVALPLFVAVKRLNWWSRLATAWLSLSLIAILLLEFASPQFIAEYDSRPNRLFVEYLVYPREVFAMLWTGYRGSLAMVVIGLGAASWLIVRHFNKYRRCSNSWSTRAVLIAWPIVVLLLFVMIRSSFQHRPANLATFAFCDDAMVNSLVTNSAYSVLSAVYGLKHEGQSEIYGEMPAAEMISRVRNGMGASPQSFTSDQFPTLHKQVASVRRERPLNLVIVLEESLGAGFVEQLGGLPITPNISGLADQGIWFEQLYATGTRSVRGIEAVVAGFPPTPALSVVKLNKSQRDFATLASVLRRAGYRNEFVYGGESHFDNMRGFFLGNGFHDVVDRKDFLAPKFVGSWGVSDEDLFQKAHERLSRLHESQQPFFMLVFSSTNHTPFEFPDGRIELHEQPKQTVHNAVKYADHAVGGFLKQARASKYWADTLVMVVADHDTRVYGDELVPVNKFHIPGVILGADTQPRRIDSTVSQIDLAPTLLSLMGVDSEHPLVGRDLTRTLPEFGNREPLPVPRAMMQFDRNFAWLQGNQVTVLVPDGDVRYFTYDRRAKSLEPAQAHDSEIARTALANVLMPAWLYRDQLYRLPN
ncbi:LTA synthase family protein [Steroidobacter sp.]|uniref:LTA synthase family protein n=1 Tax=Steroidobacter sp. TaxID=1978227 RepID=UPI001A56AEDD|nr:LTA synthase family protein [Steroidobacter sp.]MBL8269730.1 sulfatase-like hydrolase/transferase [Steroidobacter sp.]